VEKHRIAIRSGTRTTLVEVVMLSSIIEITEI